MAEFPPNLDDGEHYLPSDIFLNQKIPTRANPPHHHHHHRSYMDDLAHHFTALSLLRETRPTPSLKAPHNLEVSLNSRFRPPVHDHVVNPHPLRPHSYHRLQSCLELEVEVGQRPFCDIHFPKPTPCPNDRVLVQQRQPNRLLVQQNRVLPYQGSGFGSRGGVPREYGGTGVFHPRIINTFTSSGSDSKKKQSVRDKEEMQKSERRKPMKRVVVGVSEREDCYYHLPPEMGLPRDWTY